MEFKHTDRHTQASKDISFILVTKTQEDLRKNYDKMLEKRSNYSEKKLTDENKI